MLNNSIQTALHRKDKYNALKTADDMGAKTPNGRKKRMDYAAKTVKIVTAHGAKIKFANRAFFLALIYLRGPTSIGAYFEPR